MGDLNIIYTEQNIISCCIHYNVLITSVDEKYFITETATDLFKAVVRIVDDKKDITERSIMSELDKFSESEITQENVHVLMDLNINVHEFDAHYKELKEQWAKYQINKKILPEVLRESTKRSDYDLNKFRELSDEINNILDETSSEDNSEIRNPIEMFKEYEKTLYKRESLLNNYTTGCTFLDDILTERFSTGTMSIIFGPSGVGKSSYVRYLVNMCLNKQIPSVYYTLEMSFDSTMDSLCSQRLRIPLKNFYPDANGWIDPMIIDKVKKEKDKIERIESFRLASPSTLSIPELRKDIRIIRKEMGLPEDDNIIVFIDLLTMIAEFNKVGNGKAASYEDGMNELHSLSREEHVHICGVVQGKRPQERMNITEIDQLSRFRPQPETIKNAGAILERARIVIGIFRQKHFAMTYLPDNPETQIMPDIMEVFVMKQNMGALGSLDYLFQPEMNLIQKYGGELQQIMEADMEERRKALAEILAESNLDE